MDERIDHNVYKRHDRVSNSRLQSKLLQLLVNLREFKTGVEFKAAIKDKDEAADLSLSLETGQERGHG